MHQEGSKSRFKEEQPFREGEGGGGEFAFLPLPLPCFSQDTQLATSNQRSQAPSFFRLVKTSGPSCLKAA